MSNLPELTYYPIWVLYAYPTSSRIWYLIPYELLPSNYESKMYGKYYKTYYGILIYGRSFPDWLMFLTGMNIEHYYRRFYLNIADNRVYKCSVCGKPYRFDKLSRGYVRTCSTPGRCILLEDYRDEIYKKFLIRGLNSTYSQAQGRCTQFNSKGESTDICLFYLCMTPDYEFYKFGITSEDIQCRSKMFYCDNKYYHVLVEDQRWYIAELEKLVKINLDQISELIPINQFSKFKNAFINSLNELTKMRTNKIDASLKY